MSHISELSAAFASEQSKIYLFSTELAAVSYLSCCRCQQLAHFHRSSCCLQAGVAASRSLEEVAELEKAVCLLIQRAADIYDAKSAQLNTEMAATLAKLQPGSSDGSSLAVSLNHDHSMGEAERAVHAEASTSNVGDESADGVKTTVSATSELITPEVEKQLPRSARRVRSFLLGKLAKQAPW